MKLRIARKVAKSVGKRCLSEDMRSICPHKTMTHRRSGKRLARSVSRYERRVTHRIRRQWSTPTIREVNICDNCDGAPDGGHVSDAFCIWTLEDM